MYMIKYRPYSRISLHATSLDSQKLENALKGKVSMCGRGKSEIDKVVEEWQVKGLSTFLKGIKVNLNFSHQSSFLSTRTRIRKSHIKSVLSKMDQQPPSGYHPKKITDLWNNK